MRKIIIYPLFITLLFSLKIQAQSVVISKNDEANPAGSAILDVQSDEKGMLVPRMSQSQRNNISSPADGLLIYQTDNTPGFYYYNGSAWQALRSEGITSENDPQVGTITTNHIPKWDGSKLISGVLREENDNIGVGTEPFYKFHVDGSIYSESFISANGSLFGDYVYSSGNAYFSDEVDLGNLSSFGNGTSTVVRITNSTSGSGFFQTNGPNGEINTRITSLSGYGNHGWFGVFDGSGISQAGIYVNSSGQGVVWGDSKSFVTDHPADDSKEIVYTSLEGPEAAIYIRGTSHLTNGSATIQLPDYFNLLAAEGSMTVLVTPLSASSQGLAVTSKNSDNFTVRELLNGSGSYEFDWEVKCVRQGYENYQVVRDKQNGGNLRTMTGEDNRMPAEATSPKPTPKVTPPERIQE